MSRCLFVLPHTLGKEVAPPRRCCLGSGGCRDAFCAAAAGNRRARPEFMSENRLALAEIHPQRSLAGCPLLAAVNVVTAETLLAETPPAHQTTKRLCSLMLLPRSFDGSEVALEPRNLQRIDSGGRLLPSPSVPRLQSVSIYWAHSGFDLFCDAPG